jgi:potassium efflux system protein
MMRMPIRYRHRLPAFARAALVAATWAIVATGSVVAQTPVAAPATSAEQNASGFDAIVATLDRVGGATRAESVSDGQLDEWREEIAKLRDELRGRVETLQPRLSQAETALKQLGTAPAAGAAPEAPAIAAERARLDRLRGELDAALKQAKLLSLRADEIGERITERRRTNFTRQLFIRQSSVLDPALWTATASALVEDARDIAELSRSWATFLRINGGFVSLIAVLVTLLGAATAVALLRRWSARRQRIHEASASRFGRALSALLVFARIVLTLPALVLATVMVLDALNLLPLRIAAIGFGLVGALAIASFGRGVGEALFAPATPERRLMALDDRAARLLRDHLVWGGRILGLVVFLNALHKTLYAPVVLTVATSALLSILVAALLAHLLLRLRPDPSRPDANPHLQWLRAAAWLVIAGIIVSLVSGYVGFAAFLAGRLLTVLAVGGLLYIGLVFINALFDEQLAGDAPGGRALAAMFGLQARGIELIGTLLSAVLRILLVMLAVIPLLGPWGIVATDVFGTMRQALFGFRVGEITISPTAILGAVGLLFVGILIVRGIQHWLRTRLLPRAGLEPGLQHSVAALFGYAGAIAVIAVVLAELGIDLQKIAFIAGALSVGIGFGLQSIVSNFVSGLILLAERPIRVGDWVVVKNEEGYVRKISVRATEIETFERASVIIPNSEFITGVVKNWTHANTTGRVTVKVGVAYDSDPEKVREVLLACAREHPQVLQTPPPQALFLNFGESTLDFELRCYLANISFALMVRSDLHFVVLRRFREAGIEIPFAQRELRWRDGPPPEPSAAAT